MAALEQATLLISELQQKNEELQQELQIASGLSAVSTPAALAKSAGVSEEAAAEALRRGLQIQRREYLLLLKQKLDNAKKQQDRLMLSMHKKFKEQIEKMAQKHRYASRARSNSSTGSLDFPDVDLSTGGGSPVAPDVAAAADSYAALVQQNEQLQKKLRDAESNTKRLQDNAESLCTHLTSTTAQLQSTEAKLKALQEEHQKLVRWQLVDCTSFRNRGSSTVYDARIQDVLKCWTNDEQRIARLTSWLDGLTRGKVADSSFPRRIELLAMSQTAASGFLTKVVPLIAVHVDATIAIRPSHGQALDVASFMRFCKANHDDSAGPAGRSRGSIFASPARGRGATSPRSDAAASLLQLKLDLRISVIGAAMNAPSKPRRIGLDI